MSDGNFTTDDLARLDRAIALGAMEVAYKDRTVRYRSLSELIRARDIVRRELGLIPKGPVRVRLDVDPEL